MSGKIFEVSENIFVVAEVFFNRMVQGLISSGCVTPVGQSVL
jgi:hypothetical protein